MTNTEKIDVVKGEIKLLEGLSPSPSEKPLIEEALEIYGRVIDDLRSEGKSAPAQENTDNEKKLKLFKFKQAQKAKALQLQYQYN